MRAVITVIGKDMVGILSNVSQVCSEADINIIEVSQSILKDLFAMIMMVDISDSKIEFTELKDKMSKIGENMNLSVHVMHEDIFNSMHKI